MTPARSDVPTSLDARSFWRRTVLLVAAFLTTAALAGGQGGELRAAAPPD